jgi:hypothetical protein
MLPPSPPPCLTLSSFNSIILPVILLVGPHSINQTFLMLSANFPLTVTCLQNTQVSCNHLSILGYVPHSTAQSVSKFRGQRIKPMHLNLAYMLKGRKSIRRNVSGWNWILDININMIQSFIFRKITAI